MVIRAIDPEDTSANMEYANDQISEILEMWKSDFERLLQNWSEKWKSKHEQPEEPKEAAAPNHLYMEKTFTHQPTKVFDEMPESTLQSNYSDFLRTLVVTVHEASYPVTTETLHQIFDKYGLVEEIDILPSVENFQALVRYKSMENSISARYSLHNRCIYEGCCWLDIKYLSYSLLEEVLERHNSVEPIHSELETKLKLMYAAVKKVKAPCKLEPRPVNKLVSSIMRHESSVDVGVVYSTGDFDEFGGDKFPKETVTKELSELATEKLGSIGYVEIFKDGQPTENQQLTIESASHVNEWIIKDDEFEGDYNNAFLDRKSELIHVLFDLGGGLEGKNEALENSGNDLTDLAMRGKPDSIIGHDGKTKRCIEILSRNVKTNHVLISELGVVKIANVELARMIIGRDVQEPLQNQKFLNNCSNVSQLDQTEVFLSVSNGILIKMDVFYSTMFGALTTVVAALELSKSNKDQNNTSSAFNSFKNKYLLVYSFKMAGDWLQSPYVYHLYDIYGFGKGKYQLNCLLKQPEQPPPPPEPPPTSRGALRGRMDFNKLQRLVNDVETTLNS